MNTSIRFASAVALMVTLAACVSFGPQEQQRYYVLDPVVRAATAAATPRASTLLVMPTAVSSFYETQDIVYSRAPGTRAYYQLHAWTERPGPRITEHLLTRLDRAGSFRHVAKAAAGLRGDLLLDTQLTEFYHDATDAPGSVRITITAELSDPARRMFLARRSFTRTAPVATYDAPGAVRAFNATAGIVLDDIAAWVEATAPR